MSSLLGERFILERRIGTGGMSVVYLGRDKVLDRPVAVKVLRGDFEDSEVDTRFRREGRTAARLSHPNIVQVYDAGEDELDGRYVSYIVMEYVSGGDLEALLDKKGPLVEKKLARIGADIASGLAHAHEKGIVHRDIKPHNILIDSYGRPKLTDFGIARALDATHATKTGSYLGTALYSSPEQLQGEKVTPKSDVYSFGITFYQAAVGKVPFTGIPIEVASQHVNRTPTAPSTLGARLSGKVEALILDCIQKDPDLRPNAEEIHERLQEEAQRPHRSIRTYAVSPIPESTPAERTRTAPTEESPAAAPSGAEPPTTERTRAAALETPTSGPPHGLQHEGGRSWQRRGPVLIAAVALLFVVVGVVAAFATLGGGDADLAQNTPEENQQASSSEEGGRAADEEPAATQKQAAKGSTAGGQGDSGSAAAARVVEEFYAAAAGDYERSSNLLTADWRQSAFPSRGAFEGTFNTLEQVRFVEEPQAQVSDGTATITGETIAEHTNRTERNRGNWTLVNENGEWLISGWSVNNIGTE